MSVLNIKDLASSINLGSPLLSTHWQVASLSIGQSNYTNAKGLQAYDNQTFDSRYLSMHVESIDIPLAYFDITDMHIKASKMYYPGFNNVNSTVLTLYEDTYGNSLRRVLAWQSKIMVDIPGLEGCYELPANYKGKLIANLLSDISGEITAEVTLEGLWPSQVEPMPLSSTDDRIAIRVTLSVDSVSVKHFKVDK